MMDPIKILIVDDSAVVRQLLVECLSTPEIEVIGTAIDPFIAAEKIKNMKPDLITLDIEMPRMDGLTFLQKLMNIKPMPVIMVSSLTDKGATETIKALEYGAVDFVLKPKNMEDPEARREFKEHLIEKVLAVRNHKVKNRRYKDVAAKVVYQKKHEGSFKASECVIAIGASTGGTEVIEDILTSMDVSCPGIIVTQHMPPKFTEAFSNRIDSLSKITVKEGKDGDRLSTGTAYIAPGGTQMLLKRDIKGYFIEVNDDPPLNRHKPSVDVLFNSVSDVAGENALGVILTGMGSDGAKGLLKMKNSGSATISQDEDSCVVYGMPREAEKIGASTHVMNIEQIITFIKNNYCGNN